MRRLAGWLVLGAVAVGLGLVVVAGPPPLMRVSAQFATQTQVVTEDNKSPKVDPTPPPQPTDTTSPTDQSPTPTPTPAPTPTPPPAAIVPGTLPPLGATGAGTLSTPAGLSNVPAAAPTTVPQNNGSNPTPLVLLGIMLLALLAVGAFALSLTLR